jgi:peroxiredoxin
VLIEEIFAGQLMLKKTKALDGKTFTDRMSPDFEAVSTNGQKISLSEFRGKPVAIVFLAVHCNHSQDTLPILSSLKKEYEPQGLSILPVYVHSGTVEDIKHFAESAKVDFPLLFVTKEISNRFANRMVPTTFLIDRTGHIVRQFVGFKKQAILKDAFSKLIAENQDDNHQNASGR